MPPSIRTRSRSRTARPALRAHAPSASTSTAAVGAADAGTLGVGERKRERGESELPAHVAQNVATLSPSARGELAKLMFLFGGDRAVREAIVEALDDPGSWPMKMTDNDERRVLARAIAATPLSSAPAQRPSTVAIVRATTNGTDAVTDALALLTRAYGAGDDVTIAPEWFFVPAGAVAMSEADKDALVKTLCALTTNSDRLLVPGTIPWRDERGGYHNTAYAIAGGAVLHAVDKRGDGDDVGIAATAGLTFVSDASAPTFAWRGMRVALEICRDHGDARLRYELLGDRRGVVDVQLVVSSGVWLKHPAVGVGGATIVAQGDKSFAPEVAVRGADGLSFPEIPPGDVARVAL